MGRRDVMPKPKPKLKPKPKPKKKSGKKAPGTAKPRKSAPRAAEAAVRPSASDQPGAPEMAPAEAAHAAEDQVFASDLTLHDLFQQQTARMLARTDLSDEHKQNLLIGLSCPCCGAGGFSFTAKLKRR